jgi:hypothetical protein
VDRDGEEAVWPVTTSAGGTVRLCCAIAISPLLFLYLSRLHSARQSAFSENRSREKYEMLKEALFLFVLHYLLATWAENRPAATWTPLLPPRCPPVVPVLH